MLKLIFCLFFVLYGNNIFGNNINKAISVDNNPLLNEFRFQPLP